MFLISTFVLVSCNQENEVLMVEPQTNTVFEENDSTGVELRAARDWYHISNSSPVYEYVCNNINGTDTYYTMTYSGTYIDIRGYRYNYVGSKIKLFKTQVSDLYYQPPVYQYYSPSLKRHRLTETRPSEMTDDCSFAQDFVLVNLVGYCVHYRREFALDPAPVSIVVKYNPSSKIYRNVPYDEIDDYEYPGTQWLGCGSVGWAYKN